MVEGILVLDDALGPLDVSAVTSVLPLSFQLCESYVFV